MVTAVKSRIKKFVALVAMVVTVVSVLAGCSVPEKDDGTLNILCSVFPVYDWVREITADARNVNVELLVDRGADMHSYQATVSDVVKLASCDVFVYVGGVSDGWVEEALASAPSDNRTVLNLMAIFPEDKKICASGEHDHGHSHAEKEAYDEHLWLSIKNAEILCEKISGKLAEIDSVNSERYAANTSSYCVKLKTLDSEYEKACGEAENKTLVFGGRFPFAYLLNDYGIKHYSAFEGCSAESEASFDTVIFLVGKLNELGVPAVMTVKGDSNSIAETVIQNTKNKNQKIIELDSMQSVMKKDIDGGATYLTIMQENLAAVKAALDY